MSVGKGLGSNDFSVDKLSIPTPPAAGAEDNKFEGTGNPAQETTADISPSFHPNKFPRQKGSDSLSDEEAQLT